MQKKSDAKTYLSIVACGDPFVLISNCYANVVRSEGESGKAMMGQLLGNLLNVILDPIMILGFGWNIAGAAIATVIGNLFGALYYIQYFIRGKISVSQILINSQMKEYGDMAIAGMGVAMKAVLELSGLIWHSRLQTLLLFYLRQCYIFGLIKISVCQVLDERMQKKYEFCRMCKRKREYFDGRSFGRTFKEGISTDL